MKNTIREFFNDLEFRYTVFSNKIHIINYSKILSLENDRVSVLGNNRRIVFKGRDFLLIKLLDYEVLISGVVSGVEVYEI